MVRHIGRIFLSLIILIFFLCQNVFMEEECPDAESLPNLTEFGDGRSLAVLSRVKRGFGGKEPINFTLVQTNVLGPPGWLPLASGATLDLVFHVTGYVVLGKLISTFNWLFYINSSALKVIKSNI